MSQRTIHMSAPDLADADIDHVPATGEKQPRRPERDVGGRGSSSSQTHELRAQTNQSACAGPRFDCALVALSRMIISLS